MPSQTVTLRQSTDELGSRFLSATLADDGTLTIEGQDLGRGVEIIFGDGNIEYEWTWTLRPSSVVALCASLNCGDNLMVALAAKFSGDAAAGLLAHLDANKIAYEGWSRIGD